MGKKKAANSEAGAVPESSPAKTFQAFERMTAMRSQLRQHEANPRQIDQHALKKLREGLRKVGLVTSLIVNRRDSTNGFPPAQHGQLVIIGGHQRCRAMDELRGYDPATHENDYQIPIDVVSISAAKERELIVFLNNPAAQGSWDYSLLGDLLTSPGVDPLATGFDRLELSQILDSGIVEELFGSSSPQSAAEAPVLDAIAEVAAASKAYQQVQQPTPQQPIIGTAAPPTTPPAPLPDDDINSVASIKGRRYDFRDKTAEAGDSSHILTIVAGSGAEMDDFLAGIGLVNEAFIDLNRFATAISETSGFDFLPPIEAGGDAAAADLQDSDSPA